MHLDNREQDPHIHIHSNVSNLIRFEDGTYRVIEPRELFKNGTAERVDFQFKSIVLQMMQERLPEIPIEAYDKDFQVVEGKVGGGISEIKDFRVALTTKPHVLSAPSTPTIRSSRTVSIWTSASSTRSAKTT